MEKYFQTVLLPASQKIHKVISEEGLNEVQKIKEKCEFIVQEVAGGILKEAPVNLKQQAETEIVRLGQLIRNFYNNRNEINSNMNQKNRKEFLIGLDSL